MTTFSEAVDFYLIHADARGLSKNTVDDYMNTFAKFGVWLGLDEPPADLTAAGLTRWIAAHSQARRLSSYTTLPDLWRYALDAGLLADPPLAEIDHRQAQTFLAGFQKTHKKKTILNYHVGLSALWAWAEAEDLTPENIMRRVPPPKPEDVEVKPYTKEEITRLLEACRYNKEYGRPGARTTANARTTTNRDKALIMVLLDTGVRAGELCAFDVGDCDMRERRLFVREGKGSKERYVYFSARTAMTLQRYLNGREDKRDKQAPLFATTQQTRLSQSGLLQFIKRAGDRADVPGATVHRFRHTFAIEALRNGLNAFVLQRLLGHSSIDMVKRYIALAEVDLQQGHFHASPVDGWRL